MLARGYILAGQIIILFSIVMYAPNHAKAQSKVFRIAPKAQVGDYKLDKTYKLKSADSSEIEQLQREILHGLYDEGFLAASFDSLSLRGDTMLAYLHLGRPFRWGKVGLAEAYPDLPGPIQEDIADMEGEWVRYRDIRQLNEDILGHYENKGYPFASVRLDSLRIEDTVFYARVKIDRYGAVFFDSLVIKGTARIRPAYLYRYTGIRPGEPYSEALFRELPRRLDEILFIGSIRPPELEFAAGKASPFLYLQKKKANQFSGLVGFLPNNEETGKLMLTGEIDLALVNALGNGERLAFNWQKLQPLTQELDIRAGWPYLFGSPFGADGQFGLYKRDTTYLNMNWKLGIPYYFIGNDYIKLYVHQKSSSLISTAGLGNASVLPDYADVSVMLYGLEYRISRLDYLYNPREGYYLQASLSAGQKKISPNPALPEMLYQGVPLESRQAEGTLELSWYQPLTGRLVLKLANQSGMISPIGRPETGQFLFENEMYRIGGFSILRGFDERSIRASAYTVMSTGLRFIAERNTALFTFYDLAYYEKDLPGSFTHDTPMGFGAGISFATGAGIFSFSYALGRQFGQPVEFRNAKIHFGLVSRF